MCIGFCSPFDLGVQGWIIGIGFLALFSVTLWKDIDEGSWGRYLVDIKNGKEKRGVGMYFHAIQKTLHYVFRGFAIRQILNPYFLFPFLILLTWYLKLNNLSSGELVLIITLIVVLWYSKETQVLREEQRKANKIAKELMAEQKKAVYLQLLDMEMKDKDSGYKARIGYPLIVRRIIEKGEFDPKELYSRNWHQDL